MVVGGERRESLGGGWLCDPFKKGDFRVRPKFTTWSFHQGHFHGAILRRAVRPKSCGSVVYGDALSRARGVADAAATWQLQMMGAVSWFFRGQ